MRASDPTINPVVSATTCYYGTEFLFYAAIASTVIATATSVGFGLASASQQASAQRAAAEAQQAQAAQAQQIANYNAQIQRQNAEVAYKMSVYQAETNAQISAFNQAMAINNAQYAEAQALGAQRQYEQGQENARQAELQADAARAAGREESNRKREENTAKIAQIRAKYAASGVAQEGSPLVVLADAARLAESQVQDIAYATELESRKQNRSAEIERFKASFSLIDEMGFEAEAANQQLQSQRFAYERDLYKYDSALAGVRLNIANKEAQLTELAGGFQAYGYEAEAAQSKAKASASMLSGIGGAVSSTISGLSSGYYNYGYASGQLPLTNTSSKLAKTGQYAGYTGGDSLY